MEFTLATWLVCELNNFPAQPRKLQPRVRGAGLGFGAGLGAGVGAGVGGLRPAAGRWKMRVSAGCRLGFNPLLMPILLLLILVSPAAGEVMEPIYWNSHNERFTAPQGYVLFPQIGDRIDLICPRAAPAAAGPGSRAGPSSPAVYEYYRLYLVSREQAERCDTVLSPTVLLTCDQPSHDTRFTIKFQEYSPNLWGLEFQPQHNYYIITTSDGSKEGLENRNEGSCNTRNMKVTLRVGQDPAALDPAPDAETPQRPDPDPTDGLTIDGANSSCTWAWGGWGGRGGSGAGGGGNNNGSEPSDIIIPLRTSDSAFCPHYEKVSGDYGHPVYIVQEMPPQSPANIYYNCVRPSPMGNPDTPTSIPSPPTPPHQSPPSRPVPSRLHSSALST
ncbi:LOW QUALITY PROTEIN: ephrin-B1-like [Leucoraja erinacea]|uniref:LOW QUALITY PROTEIN: ephrin-B1-like n=1 Tax=Leucoraja erinaceus TaxID=7782 RepID=UPI0024546FE1|nr:LOW QUALITY PROTEIN: ephrin-B1-like [Leucoraja erinacea]